MLRITVLVSVAVALAQRSVAAVLGLPIWFRNSYAMVELSVGTPPVNHLLLFDTGSGSSWIVDRECANGACKNFSGYPRFGYDPKASSTSLDLGIYDSIDYLGGNTGGPAMADMFHLDNLSWNQTFIAANQSTWAFIPGDGFFGMAFSSIAQPSTETIVETMINKDILDEPKFALYYGKELNDTNGPGEGILTLGGSEEEKYVEGDMTWLAVRKDNNGTVYQLWRSTVREVTGTYKKGGADDGDVVTSEPLRWAAGKANAVFDTGASTLSVPTPVLEDMYRGIGWPGYEALVKGKFMPLCSFFNATWSVTFTFSDDGVDFFNITMRGDELRGSSGFAGRADACYPPFDDSGSNGLFLAGQMFLQSMYSVFDFGATEVENYKPRIGFGHLKKEYLPSETDVV